MRRLSDQNNNKKNKRINRKCNSNMSVSNNTEPPQPSKASFAGVNLFGY